MWLKHEDPTMPWRAEVAGAPDVLAGSKMTYLTSSHFWLSEASQNLKDKVLSLSKTRHQHVNVDSILSPEVYISLLTRFTPRGKTVLAPWDPTGVVQAASIAVGNPSITFLGLTRKMRVDSDDVPELPILGYPNNCYSVTHIISDSHGHVRPAAKEGGVRETGVITDNGTKRRKT